jgi:hypothetical protein
MRVLTLVKLYANLSKHSPSYRADVVGIEGKQRLMSNPVAVDIPHGETPPSVQEYLLELVDTLQARGIKPYLFSTEGLSTLSWESEAGRGEILVEDYAESLLYTAHRTDGAREKSQFKLGTAVETLELI